MNSAHKDGVAKGLCKECGSEVRKPGTKFCDQQCYIKYRHKMKLRNIETRVCQNCRKEFKKPRNSAGVFCSRACFHEWQKQNAKLKMGACRNCGEPLKPKLERKNGHVYQRKFCTRTCYKAYLNKRKEKSICPICGKEIETRGYRRRYCSTECRNKARPRSDAPKTCRRVLMKHHEDMKHDSQRLTTKFLAKLVGCACPKVKGDA